MRTTLYESQPTDLPTDRQGCETIGGYEIYAIDTTPDVRPEAETLEDRINLKAQKNEPVQIGQKFSWLARLFNQNTSWVAPLDVRRVSSESTDSKIATEQIQVLAQHNQRPKVIVADSLYANAVFLAVFLTVHSIFALVRLRSSANLFEALEAKKPGSRGVPRKHGAKFKMSSPRRKPDCTQIFWLGSQQIRLSAWHKLHFQKLTNLVGFALQVEFLKADGSLRFQRPMWLFWTGAEDIALQDLCRMYLWRFAIEHAFRFMKQKLGLNAHWLSSNDKIHKWVWLCALAYWQLLFMREEVEELSAPWYPVRRDSENKLVVTPG